MSSSLLESYLDFFYAKEILYRLPLVLKRTCEGCLWDSLSQTDHTCLNLIKRQKLSLYFEDVLSVIDEQDIMLKWREAVSPLEDVSPAFLAIYQLKLNCVDWRETMKTPDWKYRLIKLSAQLLRLDKVSLNRPYPIGDSAVVVIFKIDFVLTTWTTWPIRNICCLNIDWRALLRGHLS